MKKALALVLAVCMLFSCAAMVSAESVGGTSGSTVNFTTTDSGIVDSGFAATYTVWDSGNNNVVKDSGTWNITSMPQGKATATLNIVVEVGMWIQPSSNNFTFTPGDLEVTSQNKSALSFTVSKKASGGGPSGGGGSGVIVGGGSGTTTTVTAATATKTTSASVNAAIASAISAGSKSTTAEVTFKNVATLTQSAIKAINDAVAKASAGKGITVAAVVNLDTVAGGKVISRVSIDPIAAAKLGDTIKVGVSVKPADKDVKAVTAKFDKYFSNKIVAIAFAQKSSIGINATVAAKLDLSKLNTKTLVVYSYNNLTNVYTQVKAPGLFVDANGYTHVTAPMGGSIIITDKALTLN